jgi:hypothetical protein
MRRSTDNEEEHSRAERARILELRIIIYELKATVCSQKPIRRGLDDKIIPFP